MGGWNALPMRWEGAITINGQNIVAAVAGAIIGGSGLTGLLFVYMRRFIDKRLERREKEDEKHRQQRLRHRIVDDELEHATGRLFFFVHKAIVTGQHNGDLEAAWEEYQEAEKKKKALDREILAENELEE